MNKVLLICLLYIGSSCCTKFPQRIVQCFFGDTECIKATTNSILKNYYEGEPKIALSTLDPLEISRMNLKQGGNSAVNMELNFRNVKLIGLKHFTITSLKGFAENPKGYYEMRLRGPQLNLVGPYSMHGQILILPVRGNGMSNFTLSNPELHVQFTGKTKKKNSKTILYTDDLRMTFKITRMQAIFENLFNGDPVLGETTNRFMNENWQEIFNELKGSIFDAFSLITQTMLNDMWSHHDYKDLFLH